MSKLKVFVLSEVAKHKTKKDCWLVIDGKVLDVTKFLEEHPGGEEALLEVGGKDASKEFKDIGHSKAAQSMIYNYQVGVLQGFEHVSRDKDGYVNKEYSKDNNEMKAFIIKDDIVTSKFQAFLEFFVPLLVVGSYLCYVYLAK